MQPETDLRAQPPKSLGQGRVIAHSAAQFLARTAIANLAAVPDDSHTGLVWDDSEKRFQTQPISKADKTYVVGLSLSPLHLSVVADTTVVASLGLENVSRRDAATWLDGTLSGVGLAEASSGVLSYDLPPDVADLENFGPDGREGLPVLAGWFDFAHAVLSDFAGNHASLTPGPSPVRCWPHHFDIATYVGLERGDLETARGIGVGLSPGDEAYDQPYFYVNPWPPLEPADLRELPPPGHWQMTGFVGAVATAEEVLSLDDFRSRFPEFIDGAFTIGREALGV